MLSYVKTRMPKKPEPLGRMRAHIPGNTTIQTFFIHALVPTTPFKAALSVVGRERPHPRKTAYDPIYFGLRANLRRNQPATILWPGDLGRIGFTRLRCGLRTLCFRPWILWAPTRAVWAWSFGSSWARSDCLWGRTENSRRKTQNQWFLLVHRIQATRRKAEVYRWVFMLFGLTNKISSFVWGGLDRECAPCYLVHLWTSGHWYGCGVMGLRRSRYYLIFS